MGWTLLRLSVRGGRDATVSLVAVFLTLFVGVTALLASAGLMETGAGEKAPPQRLAGAQLVVTGVQSLPRENDPLPERVRLESGLVAELRAVPGVLAVVPDVSIPAAVPGRVTVGVTAHGWGSARLGGAALLAGSAPATSQDVVIDERTAAQVGEQIEVLLNGRSHRLRVTGIVGSGGAPAVFLDDATAVDALGAGGLVDAIGVVTDDAGSIAPLVERVVGDRGQVLVGDDRGYAEDIAVRGSGTRVVSVAVVFGGVAAQVVLVVVAALLAQVVAQRRRELGLLRVVGATPGQVRTLVAGEAVILAVVATVAAIIPARYLGGWLLGAMADSGLAHPMITYQQSWGSVLAAGSLVLAVAVGAALIASLAATRTRPVDALTDASAVRHWRAPVRLATAGLLVLCASALAVVTVTALPASVAATTAGTSAAIWACAVALVMPGLAALLLPVLGLVPAAVGGGIGRLAALTARGRRIAVAGAATPVMVATGMVVTLLYVQSTQAAAVSADAGADLRADAVVTATGGGFGQDAVDRIAALPGVAAASAMVPSTGFVVEPDEDPEDEPDITDVDLYGVTAAGAETLVPDHTVVGRFGDLAGATVIIPEAAGHPVGARLALRLGDGAPLTVTVIGVHRGDPDAWYTTAESVLPHTTTRLIPEVLVRVDPGVDPVAALAGLREVYPDAVVSDRAAVLADRAAREGGDWIGALLLTLVIACSTVAVCATLVSATTRRRTEFATQRAVGATRAQVLAVVAVETGLTSALGIVAGTAVAAAAVGPFSMVVTGSPVPYGPLWMYGAVALAVLTLSCAAAHVPAWIAVRGRSSVPGSS